MLPANAERRRFVRRIVIVSPHCALIYSVFMKAKLIGRLDALLGWILSCVLILWLASVPAYANLFVSRDGAGGPHSAAIGDYTNSGVVIDRNLITGLMPARDMVVSGNKIYVLSDDGTVGVYSTSGQTINRSLITGLNSDEGRAEAIAVSGKQIFIGSSAGQGSVSLFTTAGTLVNASLIADLHSGPFSSDVGDMAISGAHLFVASSGSDGGFHNTVGEYTFSGDAVDPALVTFTTGFASALAVSETAIFVRNSTNEETPGIDTIAKYTRSGKLLDPSFITGLTDPFSIAISGNDIFIGGGAIIGGIVGRYDLSGNSIDPTLLTDLVFPTVAVSGGSTAVPES